MSIRAHLIRFSAGILAVGAAWAQSGERGVFVSNNGNLEGSVTAFRIDGAGQLVFVNRVVTGSRPNTTVPCGGCNAYEIAISPDGRWLATAHAAGDIDGITVLEVLADGSIVQRGQRLLNVGEGGGLDLVWLSDEYLAYTRLDTSPDRIAVYLWNPGAATITPIAAYDSPGSLAYLVVDSDRNRLYANDSTNDLVRAFEVSPTFTLTQTDAESTGGPFPLELAISPDGAHIYAACGISSPGQAVVGYEVLADGTLSLLAGSPFLTGGSSPSNVFVTPDGAYVIAGHGTDATMRSLARNASSGALTATGFVFDVGLQGTLGDVHTLDDLVFVTDNSTATDGLMGIYSITVNADGSFTQNGPIVSTGGIAPRSVASWSPPIVQLLGDMNCDGVVSVGDIAGFVLALTDPTGYATTYPDCDIANGDINGDTAVSVGDIGPFVDLLTGG